MANENGNEEIFFKPTHDEGKILKLQVILSHLKNDLIFYFRCK